MIYLSTLFFAFGVICLISTIVVLKKFKDTYGESLGDYLNDIR